jgi:hypothetical protein
MQPIQRMPTMPLAPISRTWRSQQVLRKWQVNGLLNGNGPGSVVSSALSLPSAAFIASIASIAIPKSVQRQSNKSDGFQLREIFKDVDFPEELGGRQRIEYALWLAWRRMGNPKPPAKEVKECFAFFNACSKQLGRRQILVDAAGMVCFQRKKQVNNWNTKQTAIPDVSWCHFVPF